LLSLCWPLELYSLPKEMSHIYLNLYMWPMWGGPNSKIYNPFVLPADADQRVRIPRHPFPSPPA
ncbi:MAG: hypothetical protein QGF68_12135, partial [Nitrospinota bacterium]|nr:hypothetical protein [Nitrospinota bacterium]